MSHAFVCGACGASTGAATTSVPDHEYGLSVVVDYVECASCGSLTQTPMPSFETLSTFYPPSYHSFSKKGLLHRVKNAMRVSQLRAQVSAGGGGGAILDYGCGDGSFLVEAARALPHVFYGYEIAEVKTREEPVPGRVVIIRGSLDDLLDELPPCQLITMNHVIEHLPSPHETLGRLTGHLVDGGALQGQTPRADSLERRVFGERWSGFHAPRHTVIFSARGLVQNLQRAGLKDIVVEPAFNPAALAVSFASLAHTGAGHIDRAGPSWLLSLALAAVFAPADLFSGEAGIQNFTARKHGADAP
jgi:hypothetical protein